MFSLDFPTPALRLFSVLYTRHCDSCHGGRCSGGSIHPLMFAVISFPVFVLLWEGSFHEAWDTLRKLFLDFDRKVIAVCPCIRCLRSFVCLCFSKLMVVSRFMEGIPTSKYTFSIGMFFLNILLQYDMHHLEYNLFIFNVSPYFIRTFSDRETECNCRYPQSVGICSPFWSC